MTNVANIAQAKILLDPLASHEVDDLRAAVKFLVDGDYRMYGMAINRIIIMSYPRSMDVLASPQYESIVGAAEILERENKIALAASLRNIAAKFVDLD